MKLRNLVCLVILAWWSFGATVFAAGTEADHMALRDLKDQVTTAINARDMPAAEKLLHKPFLATVVTQESFNSFEPLKNYFESLYTRTFLGINSIKITADVDELSQIYEGTYAVARGGTKEVYEMKDGRTFALDGRWTAVNAKTEAGWKVLAIHSGVNFLDNPVIGAIEASLIWFAVGGFVAGLLLGGLLVWFMLRRRATPA